MVDGPRVFTNGQRRHFARGGGVTDVDDAQAARPRGHIGIVAIDDNVAHDVGQGRRLAYPIVVVVVEHLQIGQVEHHQPWSNADVDEIAPRRQSIGDPADLTVGFKGIAGCWPGLCPGSAECARHAAGQEGQEYNQE